MIPGQPQLKEDEVAAARHFYTCFGLRIESAIPFRELDPAAEGSADLRIRLAPPLEPGAIGGPAAENSEELARPGKTMEFSGVGRFQVGADTITISPVAGIQPADLGLPLLGPVLATFLHQRGLLVLHGNAVLLKGGLTAFVGDSGAGKSTLGGWFASHAGTLFTDDILPVSIAEDGRPLVRPGYPLVKLSQAAVETFAPPDAQVLPVGIEGYPKLRVRLKRPPLVGQDSIARICVLRRGSEAEYVRLPEMDAFRAVMENSYMIKYPDAFSSPQRQVLHLQQCTAVARSVEIGQLTVPAGLDRLHEVLPLLEDAR